jgi:aminoglycoside phosphotransferase (APT) family kinase protein
MDQVEVKVIASVRDFLGRVIESNALPSEMLTEAHMANTSLGYQLARGTYDPKALAAAHAREEQLVADLTTVLKCTAVASVDRLWKANGDVGARLVELLAADADRGADQGARASEGQVAARLREFLVAYHTPLDPTISLGTRSAYQGGRGDVAAQVPDPLLAIRISAEKLQQYLRIRFPEHACTTVSNVKRLMGGYSKETYIVQVTLEDGKPTTFVIRKDGYGLPTGSSVASEFAILREVHGLGLPVPEPLWLETDPAHFATSFMAVSFKPGAPAHLAIPTDEAGRQRWIEGLATVLASLHRSTSKPDTTVRDVIRVDIADLERRINERERTPHPGLQFGIGWLRDHLGDLDGRPACRIHGDVGFHNMLMSGDEIIALLDWEYSHYSDPLEDVVYVKPFLDQIGGWNFFLKRYEEATGFRFDPIVARYFNVWKEVRNTVACLGSLNSLLLPPIKDVALSVAGTIYIPKFEIAILDAIANGESNV